jgi:hypothetical protein
MAAKDKTPAEKTAKKKVYKKPTADRLDDSDLAGVSGEEVRQRIWGGEMQTRSISVPALFHRGFLESYLTSPQ